MVICGKCGNNTCNAGSGDTMTGEPCEDECAEAYKLMDEGFPSVIIAGGRNFDDYDFLVDSINSLDMHHPVEVVSGKARGADTLGERYAKENLYPVKEFPADWNTHGRSAGPIRNKEMADYADGLIAFWDGQSRGTKNMIDTAKKLGLEVKVFHYD